MSSLGQMVAGVAHEINTPLAYVKNSLGQVSEQLPGIGNALDHCDKLLEFLKAGNDPEGLSREFQQTTDHLGVLKQQHVIEELSALVKDGLFGTGQVSEIVGNLKNFSRLDRSKVSHSNLNESLNNTLLLAKHLLKSVTVNKKFRRDPGYYLCAFADQPGVPESRDQRGAGDAGRTRNAYADIAYAKARVLRSMWRMTVQEFRPTSCPGYSIHSSRPRRSAKARAWVCRSPTRSCRSTVEKSALNPSPTRVQNSRCGCRLHRLPKLNLES